jgi:hypothetical protein
MAGAHRNGRAVSDIAAARDLERRASSLQAQGRARDAIECYREILALDLTPINRAKMLANVMQLHQALGEEDEARAAGQRAIELIDAHRLSSNEAVFLHGVITGRLGKGTPVWNIVHIGAAWISGAALGAAVGSKTTFPGTALIGLAPAYSRHLGALVCAVAGWMVLLPILVVSPRIVSAAAIVVNGFVLAAVLSEGDPVAGTATALVLSLPLFVFGSFMILPSRSRIPTAN